MPARRRGIDYDAVWPIDCAHEFDALDGDRKVETHWPRWQQHEIRGTDSGKRMDADIWRHIDQEPSEFGAAGDAQRFIQLIGTATLHRNVGGAARVSPFAKRTLRIGIDKANRKPKQAGDHC